MNRLALFAVALLLESAPVFAQYEDLATLPDAPTRTADQESVFCTIEGVQVFKKEREKGNKDVSVVFLLTQKPSVYFNYYDPRKKAIVFDFYDTRIGESILDTIRESPITSSTVEAFKVDLNKDVAGLKPDIRDMVRVSLFTRYDFEYDVQQEESVITLSFKWNDRKESRLKWEGAAFYWEFPLLLAATGGVGFAGYELWLKKSPPAAAPLSQLPSHPASP